MHTHAGLKVENGKETSCKRENFAWLKHSEA